MCVCVEEVRAQAWIWHAYGHVLVRTVAFLDLVGDELQHLGGRGQLTAQDERHVLGGGQACMLKKAQPDCVDELREATELEWRVVVAQLLADRRHEGLLARLDRGRGNYGVRA